MLTLLMSLFIIAIMISSILSINTDENEKIKVNGYKFTKTNKGYLTYKEDKQILVTNNPTELQNFEVDKNILNLNANLKNYLSLESDAPYELRNAIQQVITTPIILAANTEEKSSLLNLPYKTCKDSKDSEGIINLIPDGGESSIFNKNCLELKGDSDYYLKVFEKLKLVSEGIL